MLTTIKDYPEELYVFLKELASTPAPLNGEQKRQDMCRNFLEKHGITDSWFDEVGNLLIPIGLDPRLSDDCPLQLMMAHSDVVFEDRDTLNYREDEARIYAPGIGDNDVHVAALLWTAILLKNKENVSNSHKHGCLLLVVNVGEEGLGNLRGSKAIAGKYGSRIKNMVTLDSLIPEVVVKSVGSKRFRISVETKGGHSFRDFGQANAIHQASKLIKKLYELKVPEESHTTFNVGLISGGTSVNTISQSAVFLYEIRSDDQDAMNQMLTQFKAVLVESGWDGVETGEKSANVAQGELGPQDVRIQVEVLGERPCMGQVDEAAQEALIQKAFALQNACYDDEAYTGSGSTDANSFQSIGIPSVCIGCCRGSGAHTYEEYVEKSSLGPGLKLAVAMAEYLVESLSETDI